MKSTRFRLRAFTALFMLWSFVVETISGIILYVVPPGRVAYWTNWKLWGMTKTQWDAVHTIFGYVFLIFGVLHIYYNWKPILNYIKRKMRTGLNARAEIIISLGLTWVIAAATAYSLPPFSSIMNIGESLKNSWEENSREPFVPHAELLSFKEFTKQIGVPLEQALSMLKSKNIVIQDTNLTLKILATKSNMAPADFYDILRSSSNALKPGNRESSGGYGSKTINSLGRDLGLPTSRILEFLKSKGIKARGEDIIRDVAADHAVKPYELVQMIQSLKK